MLGYLLGVKAKLFRKCRQKSMFKFIFLQLYLFCSCWKCLKEQLFNEEGVSKTSTVLCECKQSKPNILQNPHWKNDGHFLTLHFFSKDFFSSKSMSPNWLFLFSRTNFWSSCKTLWENFSAKQGCNWDTLGNFDSFCFIASCFFSNCWSPHRLNLHNLKVKNLFS